MGRPKGSKNKAKVGQIVPQNLVQEKRPISFADFVLVPPEEGFLYTVEEKLVEVKSIGQILILAGFAPFRYTEWESGNFIGEVAGFMLTFAETDTADSGLQIHYLVKPYWVPDWVDSSEDPATRAMLEGYAAAVAATGRECRLGSYSWRKG